MWCARARRVVFRDGGDDEAPRESASPACFSLRPCARHLQSECEYSSAVVLRQEVAAERTALPEPAAGPWATLPRSVRASARPASETASRRCFLRL